MPDMDWLDEIEEPRTHLRMYVGALKPMGICDELLAQLFHRSLMGAALT